MFDAIGSTSDLCAVRAAAGEPAGLAVLAHRQTAGRGSNGRGWESPAGNLSLSVLLRPGGAASEAGWWSLLAGVVLLDALAAEAPDISLQLKWPNDVVVAHPGPASADTGRSPPRKIGGVLIETTLGQGGAIEAMVVGFGANLASAPTLPDRVTACVAAFGPAPAPEVVARRVLTALDVWTGRRESVREAWLARTQPIGSALTATVNGTRFDGRFAGLSDGGHLLLDDGTTTRTLATGRLD